MMAENVYSAGPSTAGLLTDRARNDLFNNFAGGLLSGYRVNQQPINGMYFTPQQQPQFVNEPIDPEPTFTMDDLTRMLIERQNQMNMLNDLGADDGSGNVGVDLPGPNAEYTSFDDAMAGMFGGLGTGGFLDLYSTISPIGAILNDVGLLGNVVAFPDGYSVSAQDGLSEGQFDDFDADMQAEE